MERKKMRQKAVSKEKQSQPPSSDFSLGNAMLHGMFQGFSFGSGSTLAHNLFRREDPKPSQCPVALKNFESYCSDKSISMYTPPETIEKCNRFLEEIKETCSK